MADPALEQAFLEPSAVHAPPFFVVLFSSSLVHSFPFLSKPILPYNAQSLVWLLTHVAIHGKCRAQKAEREAVLAKMLAHTGTTQTVQLSPFSRAAQHSNKNNNKTRREDFIRT